MGEEEKRRCCILGGCGCLPPQQAKALATELGIPEDAAVEILASYRLVPQDIDSAIHEGLDRDLKAYLQARGLPVEKEGSALEGEKI